jgi:hypothetical protein
MLVTAVSTAAGEVSKRTLFKVERDICPIRELSIEEMNALPEGVGIVRPFPSGTSQTSSPYK